MITVEFQNSLLRELCEAKVAAIKDSFGGIPDIKDTATLNV